MEAVESDTHDKNLEITALKQNISILAEESKSVRAELDEAKKKILYLKRQLEDESIRFQEENKKLARRMVVLEESVKNLREGGVMGNKNIVITKDVNENVSKIKIKELDNGSVAVNAGLAVLDMKGDVNVYEMEDSTNTIKEFEKIGKPVSEDDSSVSDADICNVKEITANRTVFAETFCGMGNLKYGELVYGEKFYCQPNGHRFRLIINNCLGKEGFKVGIQACRGDNEELKPFDRNIVFSSVDCYSNEYDWKLIPNPTIQNVCSCRSGFNASAVSGLTRFEHYGSTFDIPAGEKESERNIYWPIYNWSSRHFVIDDVFTITCTMEVV